MHIAAAHHPPTTRRHYPAGQRMKGVVDRLFARQNPGAMSLSRPEPARPISVSPSTSRRSTAASRSSPGPARAPRNLVGLKMPRALEILDVTLRGIERGEIGTVEAIDALLTEELTIR